MGNNTVIKPLGKGSFGAVYQVNNTEHGGEIALKVCRPESTDEETDRFKQENLILQRLHSPDKQEQVVFPLSENQEDSSYLYYLMELADSNLDRYISMNFNLTPAELISIFKKICLGVKHAHQQNVIHRDLWWNNILICLGEDLGVKLCDFGRAKDHDLEPLNYMQRPCVGHSYVRPPELFFTIYDETDILLSKKTDFYALGVLLSFLFSGSPIIYYSQLVGDIGTFIQQKHANDVSDMTLAGKKTLYQEWLLNKGSHSYENLHVSLTDFDLTESLNNILTKLSDLDYTKRYNSIEEIEQDIKTLNL